MGWFVLGFEHFFILITKYSSPRISHFSILLIKSGVRNQDLGARCARYYKDVIDSRPSRMTEPVLDLYTYTCKVFLYISICVYIHVNVNSYRCLPPSASIFWKRKLFKIGIIAS